MHNIPAYFFKDCMIYESFRGSLRSPIISSHTLLAKFRYISGLGNSTKSRDRLSDWVRAAASGPRVWKLIFCVGSNPIGAEQDGVAEVSLRGARLRIERGPMPSGNIRWALRILELSGLPCNVRTGLGVGGCSIACPCLPFLLVSLLKCRN